MIRGFEKLNYELEFITPAFIGGAEQDVSELRPASIVGMLRYWFRIIAGSYVKDTEELFELESELFGDQKKAGKVWVRVRGNVKNKNLECITLKGCNVAKGKLKIDKDCGKVYLGYGNILYLNLEKHKNKYRKLYEICIKKGIRKGNLYVKSMLKGKQRALVEIIFPTKYRNKVEALLYIFSQLGALGSRNRRGWGNFYLIPKQESIFKNWSFWNVEELKKALDVLTGGNLKELPFDIYIFKEKYKDPKQTLEEIGKFYRKFRFKKEPDRTNILKFLKYGEKDNLEKEGVKRAYFGMPIIFRFLPNVKGEVEVKTDTGRFASPLIFRIIRLEDGEYSCLLMHLKETPKPKKVKIQRKVNNKKEEIITNKLSPEIFEEFLEKTKAFKEVKIL